jgi:hypothetical protein
MNNKFYNECLTTVREIAKELDELAANPQSGDELEKRAEELELDIADYECDEIGPLTEAEQEELQEMKEELEAIRKKLDNGEATDLYSYFEDALDIEYRISGDGEYRSVAVTITTGGPHIEIDTSDRAVKLWWGSVKAQWGICGDTACAIDDIFEEYYQLIK